MNTRINGSLQNPANVTGGRMHTRCVAERIDNHPGYEREENDLRPWATDWHLNDEIEWQERVTGRDPQEMNVVQDQDLNQHKHHEIYETTQ